MKKRNRIIWLYTVQFLALFHSLRYDEMSIALPLVRDFQRWVNKHYTYARSLLTQTYLDQNLQRACEPYLPKSCPNLWKTGKILVRSTLYPLTNGMQDQEWIYLAHNKSEYEKMLHTKECRPLFYLSALAEAKFAQTEEDNIQEQVHAILTSPDTPPLFTSTLFTAWLSKKLQHLLRRVRKVHTLFEEHPIKKVVYGSTINRHGALLATFAQSRNIQTINIQHGVLGEVGHLPVNADLQLVWGRSHQQYLQSYGVLPEKMRIIPPLFPRSCHRETNVVQTRGPSASTEPKTGEQSERRSLKILVAIQPLGRTFNKKMIKNIEKAAQHFSQQLFITYKLHPDQKSGKRYEKLIDPHHARIHTHKQICVHDFISASDLIITPYSTVAYEALVAKKPVVFYGKPQNIYYLKGKPTFVKSERDFQLLFSQVIQDPTYLSSLLSKTSLKDAPPAHVQDPRSTYGKCSISSLLG